MTLGRIWQRIKRRRGLWSTAVYLQDALTLPPTGEPDLLLGSPRGLASSGRAHTRADPFVYTRGGKLFVFYEVQGLDDPGEIWMVCWDETGWSAPQLILREKHHLSFPHIVEIEGQPYLLPERQQAGELWLYSFDDFPIGVRPFRQLALGRHADPVTLFHDGRWYLFSTTQNGLEIRHCRDLLADELVVHPMSPVAEPQRRRAAGGIFRLQGMLVRPTQRMNQRYGENIRLWEIEELSPTRFRERKVHDCLVALDQRWNRDGAHHLSVAPLPNGGHAVAIDGRLDDLFLNKIVERWLLRWRRRRREEVELRDVEQLARPHG